MRTVLYVAAINASCSLVLRAFRRLLDAGKPKFVAIITIARKLLTILTTLQGAVQPECNTEA